MSYMQFYFTPGSCTTGIHILLEEVEEIFEAHRVDLLSGDHRRPEFLTLNPKASIPVLVLADGRVLSDWVAIAWWLAQAYPKKQLLPGDAATQAQTLGWLGYVVNTLHGHGYTRFFTPEKYTDYAEQQTLIKAQGREKVLQGLALLEAQLRHGGINLQRFSILDAGLFYVLFWADRSDIPLPPLLQQHYQQLLQRPTVRQVLMEEGYHRVLGAGVSRATA